MDEMLGCLLDVLGLLKIEPDLPGRVTGGGIPPRADAPFWDMFETPPILSAMLSESRIPP